MHYNDDHNQGQGRSTTNRSVSACRFSRQTQTRAVRLVRGWNETANQSILCRYNSPNEIWVNCINLQTYITRVCARARCARRIDDDDYDDDDAVTLVNHRFHCLTFIFAFSVRLAASFIPDKFHNLTLLFPHFLYFYWKILSILRYLKNINIILLILFVLYSFRNLKIL